MFENQTHLDILLLRIASRGTEPFFKAIREDAPDGLGWDVITYAQFGRDIDNFSTKLRSVLQVDGVQDGAVVGLWLSGFSYIDVVYIYALCKAGYIPNMLPTALTDPTVILTLFTNTGAEALLHEPGLNVGANCKFPTYTPADINVRAALLQPPIPITLTYDPERLAFILYTSGSTGEMPGSVPYSNKWIKSVYDSWESVWNPSGHDTPQDVFNVPASFVGPTTLHALFMVINFGGAFVQSTTPFFSTEELLQLTSMLIYSITDD